MLWCTLVSELLEMDTSESRLGMVMHSAALFVCMDADHGIRITIGFDEAVVSYECISKSAICGINR